MPVPRGMAVAAAALCWHVGTGGQGSRHLPYRSGIELTRDNHRVRSTSLSLSLFRAWLFISQPEKPGGRGLHTADGNFPWLLRKPSEASQQAVLTDAFLALT